MNFDNDSLPENAYDAKLRRMAYALRVMEEDASLLSEFIEGESNTCEEDRRTPESMQNIISMFLDCLYSLWDIVEGTKEGLIKYEPLNQDMVKLDDIKEFVVKVKDIAEANI